MVNRNVKKRQLMIQIQLRRAAGKEYSCILSIFICVTPPDQTNDDKDLKLGTHTPIEYFTLVIFNIPNLAICEIISDNLSKDTIIQPETIGKFSARCLH